MADLDEIYDIENRSEAVKDFGDGILVCRAGPGTGKTWAFLKRVEALTKNTKSAPDEICYLTFIREISKAFAADYSEEQKLLPQPPEEPRMSTLHSFSCRLIRNHGYRKGLVGPLFFCSIADIKNTESEVFLDDLFSITRGENSGSRAVLRKHLNAIKKAWQEGTEPSALPVPVPDVFRSEQGLARAYRLVDWDETIPLAHELIGTGELRPAWIKKVQHYLVDEYQDFNPSEQSFIAKLAAEAKSTIVVGDEHQSIYSGRGGSPEGLRTLAESAAVDSVTFAICYRCKSEILKPANTFLKVIDPDSQPMRPHFSGGNVECFSFKSAKAEFEYLANAMKDRLEALPDTPKPKDGVVCLLPTRQAMDFYMQRLSEVHGVACYSRRREPDLRRQRLERALKLLFSPGQKFAERLVLEDFDGVKRKSKDRMVGLIVDGDLSPTQALQSLAENGEMNTPSKEAVASFTELCIVLSTRDYSKVPEVMASYTGIESDSIAETIDKIVSMIDEPDQEDSIGVICDLLVPESVAAPEDPKSVLFLTMHGSKGLTRKTVILPGLERAALPGAAKPEKVEDQQRLFFVALTRATDEVLVTYPRTRSRGDPFNFPTEGRGEPSPFVGQSGLKWTTLY